MRYTIQSVKWVHMSIVLRIETAGELQPKDYIQLMDIIFSL